MQQPCCGTSVIALPRYVLEASEQVRLLCKVQFEARMLHVLRRQLPFLQLQSIQSRSCSMLFADEILLSETYLKLQCMLNVHGGMLSEIYMSLLCILNAYGMPGCRHLCIEEQTKHLPPDALPVPDVAVATQELNVTWLGTASTSSTRTRNVSCTAVRLPGSTLLIDCGEGSLRQLMEVGVDPLEIDG
jgi:hypothetical protein